MAESTKSARELNEEFLYTSYSVFRAARPLPDDRTALSAEVDDLLEQALAKDVYTRGCYEVSGYRADADLMIWWTCPDVLVVAAHDPVLGEHAAALVVRQQVPLQRADERVDAGVLLRVLAPDVGRDVVPVELGRPVQPVGRPDGLEVAPERGLPEAGVDLLQRVHVRAGPPEHQVGVAAVARDVVAAPGVDVLGQRLLEQVVDLGGDRGAVVGQRADGLEDGVRGVQQLVVEFPRGLGALGHELIVPPEHASRL